MTSDTNFRTEVNNLGSEIQAQSGVSVAERRTKPLSGKAQRCAKDINHQISKQLVDITKHTGQGNSPMKKIRRILSHPGIHVLLFCLCFIFFGWPFLTNPAGDISETVFIYPFLIWGGSIVILALVAASLNTGDKAEEPREEA